MSVIFDYIGAWRNWTGARSAALYTLFFGACAGVLAVAAGYFDFWRGHFEPATDEFLDMHMFIGWVILGYTVLILIARFYLWRKRQNRINAIYGVFAGILLCLVLFQGWFGGEIVYSYGAGVTGSSQGLESRQHAQHRLKTIHALIPGSDEDKD